MGNAAPEVQWTMNFCLAGIGIHFPKHRKRAIASGEKLGIYRDYPVSKGCTSPFAPIWITKWCVGRVELLENIHPSLPNTTIGPGRLLPQYLPVSSHGLPGSSGSYPGNGGSLRTLSIQWKDFHILRGPNRKLASFKARNLLELLPPFHPSSGTGFAGNLGCTRRFYESSAFCLDFRRWLDPVIYQQWRCANQHGCTGDDAIGSQAGRSDVRCCGRSAFRSAGWRFARWNHVVPTSREEYGTDRHAVGGLLFSNLNGKPGHPGRGHRNATRRCAYSRRS